MKLVIIEPLGVEKDKLLSIARNALKDSVEIIYYDTKTLPWMHARQMVSLYATVQDIPLQQFRILYLAC